MPKSNKPNNTCRVCLNVGITMSIFEQYHSISISAKIMSLANVEILPEDGLPATICKKCVNKLSRCVKFIKLCRESDKSLRALLKTTKFLDDDEKLTNLSPIKDTGASSDREDSCQTPVQSVEVISDVKPEESNEQDKILPPDIKDMTCKKAQKHQCFICGKIMSSGFRLKTHLRIHSGERPFSCLHCNKTFALAQNLKVHLRTHMGEKPLKCPECDSTFAQSSNLKVHLRRHTGQTPYSCHLCPRKFRSIGHLQYHVRLHTGEKNFECDNCGKAFITRSQLKQHLMSHGAERPHACCVCGLRVKRAAHLRRHMQLIHNPEKTSAAQKTRRSVKEKKKTDAEITKLCEAKTVNDSGTQASV